MADEDKKEKKGDPGPKVYIVPTDSKMTQRDKDLAVKVMTHYIGKENE